MKTLLPLAFATLVLPLVHADTIRMKDGRELEGIVVSDEGDEYVLLVQVTKTIRDQRRVAKSEVLEIVAEKKDAAAFEALTDVLPAPDGLDTAGYDARIARVKDFLKGFPDSRHVRKVEPMLAALEQERSIVAAGGIKFEGRMLGADERQANAFTLDSQVVAAKVDEAIAAGQRIAALRAWDDLQKDFPTSRACLAAMPKILVVMKAQLDAITQELETIDQRTSDRSANLERVPEKDRARARQAIAEQSADYLRTIEEEKEQGIRWISLDPFQKEPLDRVKSLLEAEIRRLESLDTSKIAGGDEAWSRAWTVLNGNPDEAAARQAVSDARSAGLSPKYLALLEAKIPAK